MRRYEFGLSDDISDTTLKKFLEDTEWNRFSSDVPDTLEELRKLLALSRYVNVGFLTVTESPRHQQALNAYDDVITYVLKDEQKSKAVTAQREAIKNGWDMNLSFSIPRITDGYLE